MSDEHDDLRDDVIDELTCLGRVHRADADDLAVFITQMVVGLKIGDWRQALKWRDALTRKLRKMRKP